MIPVDIGFRQVIDGSMSKIFLKKFADRGT